MASKGYIKIWRKVWDDPLFDSRRVFSKFEAWIDLIMLAAGKDKDVDFLGETIRLRRGQLATSQSRLAKRWGWSRWRVNKFLELLSTKTIQKLSIKLYHKTTVITVLNYNKYNPLPAAERPQIVQQNDRRTTGTNKGLSKDIINNKEIPKKKNPGKEKKLTEEQLKKEFGEFWDYYDYKIIRQDAFKAFKALRRKGVEFETIMKATKGYLGFLKQRRVHENFEQQKKYPAGFLRNEYWKDYIDFKYRPPM